jgi:hypothetical protein
MEAGGNRNMVKLFMVKILVALALLMATTEARAVTLTAGALTPFTTIEFNADPNTATGPDYNYIWIPSGFTRNINGSDITGPGWYVAVYDFDWNTVQEEFILGAGSIETVCGVALVSYYFDGLSGTVWLNTDGASEFLTEWTSRDGSFVGCPVVLFSKGKKLGHSK